MNSHYIIVWDSIHYIEDKTALIFTEKTWIPIFCGKPILFMYRPGALQKFKSQLPKTIIYLMSFMQLVDRVYQNKNIQTKNVLSVELIFEFCFGLRYR